MKFKLINPPNENYSAREQVFINRGLTPEEIQHYLHLSDADINEPEVFGERLLYNAACALEDAISNTQIICMVVDCDCDGYTSSAIMMNYIYDVDPLYATQHIHLFMHEGKQHGLSDCFEAICQRNPDLVIIPDAGSNDVTFLKQFEDKGVKVIILDHHEVEEQDFWRTEKHEGLFLINSQSPQYPNKELSGAGVVWQFCRYLDKKWNHNYADWYLDLVALGLDGDMMSLKSPETRWLIFKGLIPDNIHNPFIYEMWQKNKFKLGDFPTAWGATFYIVPLVNAITRSGTMEEKSLILQSMLKFKALEEVPSTKRGHKAGETETIVAQAVRTCTNVKNRQTRAEDAGIELVTHLIEKDHMMDHKVLLFLLEPGQIKAEIRGLVANKLMAKYQRPCCMLTKVDKDGLISYQGSARGCDMVGVTEFKDICASTGVVDYTIGHQGAFGLGITAGRHDEREGEVFGENICQFLDKTDEILKDMPDEPIYYVDYLWRPNDVNPEAILEIADMDKYWGKDMQPALVAIKGLQITKSQLTMMASNTMKITLPNGVAMIKFRTPDEEFDKLYSENGYVEVNVVAECNANEWMGNVSPQLMIKDMEIVGGCAYVF